MLPGQEPAALCINEAFKTCHRRARIDPCGPTILAKGANLTGVPGFVRIAAIVPAVLSDPIDLRTEDDEQKLCGGSAMLLARTPGGHGPSCADDIGRRRRGDDPQWG